MITKNYLTFNGSMLAYNNISLYFPSIVSNTGNDTFFYPHVCAIYRSDGSVDANGDEIFTGLYYGDCAYDLNSNGGMRLLGISMQADAVVVIPSIDIAFQLNDRIEVEVELGRFITGIIEQIEVVTEPEIAGTTFWIKNANG